MDPKITISSLTFHSILHQDIGLLLGALTQPNNLAPKFSHKSLSKVLIIMHFSQFIFQNSLVSTNHIKISCAARHSFVLVSEPPNTNEGTTAGLASSLLGSLQNRLKKPWNIFHPNALPSNTCLCQMAITTVLLSCERIWKSFWTLWTESYLQK